MDVDPTLNQPYTVLPVASCDLPVNLHVFPAAMQFRDGPVYPRFTRSCKY